MCRVEDCDPWDFFHTESRKAGKPHVCCECGRSILRGEQHQYSVGKMDSRISNYRQCTHCLAAAHWLQITCGGWLFEGVLEELREHWDEEPELRSHVLMRLIRGMKRKWEQGTAPVPNKDEIAASIPAMAHA
jgi:hypothetical protein